MDSATRTKNITKIAIIPSIKTIMAKISNIAIISNVIPMVIVDVINSIITQHIIVQQNGIRKHKKHIGSIAPMMRPMMPPMIAPIGPP